MIRHYRGGAVLCLLGLAHCDSKLVPYCLDSPEALQNPDALPVDGPDPSGAPADDTVPGAPGGIPTQGTATGGADPAGGPASAVTRFIAMGDGGRGNDNQYRVADAIEQVCAQSGCDFAIYLGDNIYDDGVSGVDDPQFEEKFEAPYRNIDMPFYMALGNHDWGGDAGAQVEYTFVSDKWEMASEYYTHVQGDATFVVLDTNSLNDGDDAQMEWAAAEVAAATTTWKFAYGHHPYISNGDHGNTGGDLESFFDASLCGNIDVFFAGHDHDLEWLEPVCGTEFIISGAASETRDVGGDNPTFFEASTLGFMWVELDGRTFTGVFYDDTGTELYRRTFQK